MKTVVSVIAALFWTSAADAKEVIRCASKGKPDVVITLNGERKFKRILSCISGNFIADMTPCAPDGGFGLSYPTGTASLSGVVDRWQDYGDHIGGVTSHWTKAHQIHFDGGFMGSGFKQLWSFNANRLTGQAKLSIPKGEEGAGDYEYACVKATPRF